MDVETIGEAVTARFPQLQWAMTERSFYFDRWGLPPGLAFPEILSFVVEKVAATGQVVWVLDTNPNPDVWLSANIVTSEIAARFPGRDYNGLFAEERAQIFQAFADRIRQKLASPGPKVFIIDHHFDVPLLQYTSTTPLTVDFLNWLIQQPPSVQRSQVLEACENGFVIRDHADADITLSNFALGSVSNPAVLAKWGKLLKAVALYNDHVVLPPAADQLDPGQIMLSFLLAEAFEDEIAKNLHAGFDAFFSILGPMTVSIEDLLRQVAGQPATEFMSQVATGLQTRLDQPASRADHHRALVLLSEGVARRRQAEAVLSAMGAEAQSATDLEVDAVDESLFGKIRRAGQTLLVMIDPKEHQPPSSADVLWYLTTYAQELLEGVNLIAIVAEEHPQGLAPQWKVKLRSAHPRFDLAAIIKAIRMRGYGGGGRAGAGQLFGPTGAPTAKETFSALEWLIATQSSLCEVILTGTNYQPAL